MRISDWSSDVCSSDLLETVLRADTGTAPAGGLRFVGQGLQRPECVLTHRSGTLYVSDHRGGILCLHAYGRQQLTGESALLPNGRTTAQDGGFLVANLGAACGVWRVASTGAADRKGRE